MQTLGRHWLIQCNTAALKSQWLAMPKPIGQELPKLGSDMSDSQPTIIRTGSLPEPRRIPRSILKKAKTESFVQTQKSLRFAAEAEIREISPRRPSAPSALTQAVVVGRPVDPVSIPHLEQLVHGPLTFASAAEDVPVSAIPESFEGPGGLLQHGRMGSVSLLPDLQSFSDSSEVKVSFQATEAAQAQVFKTKSANASYSVGDTFNHGLQHSQSPAVSESTLGSRKLPHGTEAAPSPSVGDTGDTLASVQRGTSPAACSVPALGPLKHIRHSTQMMQAGKSQETPLGSDTSDSQPSMIMIRTGSLPEPRRIPRSILKKAKTESFVQTQKSLRFAAEAEIREISPRRPSAPTVGAIQESFEGHGGLLQRGRMRSVSLLPDLQSILDSSEVKRFQTEAAHSDNFRVKVEHQCSTQRGDEKGLKSQAEALGFLTWREPNTCDPGPTPTAPTDGCQNPIASLAQYLYQMTQMTHPSEPEAEYQSDQPLQAEVQVLKTTVNCANELLEMYARRGLRSRKGRKQRKRSVPPSPHRCGMVDIPRSQWEHCNARKAAWSHEVSGMQIHQIGLRMFQIKSSDMFCFGVMAQTKFA